MKQLFAEIFIWWHKQTFGIRVRTLFAGKSVGTDEMGNVYYHNKKTNKRWVVYNGPIEASTIPPGWHAWMHHRVDEVPLNDDYKPFFWQKPHQENLTGSSSAHYPKGSLLKSGTRAKVSADYDAWSPK